MDYTATALLASIRRRAMLPAASSSGTADSDLLALANEELQLRLASDLMSVREDYFVRYEDVPLVSVQAAYRIPSRAIGGILRDVAMVDGDRRMRKLPRLSLERLEEFGTTGAAEGYFLQGNSVVLVPGADTSWPTLRLYFFARPSEITITPGDYAPITNIDRATNTITVASTTGLTSNIDLVASTPGFEHHALNVTPASSTATTLRFSALPAALALGDYVCKADRAPVPQVPAEWHPVLAQRVAVKVLEALGDSVGMQAAQVALLEMEEKVRGLSTPRVQGGQQKIINRASPIRRSGWRRNYLG